MRVSEPSTSTYICSAEELVLAYIQPCFITDSQIWSGYCRFRLPLVIHPTTSWINWPKYDDRRNTISYSAFLADVGGSLRGLHFDA